MPAHYFEIKPDQAFTSKIKNKKVKNIWIANANIDGFMKIGSWYPKKEQAKAHIKRALPGVVFKDDSSANVTQESSLPMEMNYESLPTSHARRKHLVAIGGVLAGLTVLGLVFHKKIKKLIKR